MLPWSEVRSKTRPTSVHALRPGDIDVVGAMGDSLTAANGAGASNVFQVLIENRGVSWSIGNIILILIGHISEWSVYKLRV